MTERIKQLKQQATKEVWGNNSYNGSPEFEGYELDAEKFAELIVADMHRKVIASILITDVVMEEKGQKPTSEDYIRAINKDFGVEE
jgi:hypothetical protein